MRSHEGGAAGSSLTIRNMDPSFTSYTEEVENIYLYTYDESQPYNHEPAPCDFHIYSLWVELIAVYV